LVVPSREERNIQRRKRHASSSTIRGTPPSRDIVVAIGAFYGKRLHDQSLTDRLERICGDVVGREAEEQRTAEPARLVVDAPARADKRAAVAAMTAAPPSNSSIESGAASVVAEPPACNVYQGWWTYDAEGTQAPLYREPECEFLTEQVTCMRNGRRDDSYQKWRWQPTDCDLPRYVHFVSPFVFSEFPV
jgi:hypothetical protein